MTGSPLDFAHGLNPDELIEELRTYDWQTLHRLWPAVFAELLLADAGPEVLLRACVAVRERYAREGVPERKCPPAWYRTCVECGSAFVSKIGTAKFCSRRCNNRAAYRRRRHQE